MTDKEIVQKLIDRDNQVTEAFFLKHCKPLFRSIIRNTFDYQVDYNEFVNELYVHLMEDDARRLRTFNFSSSLLGWLKMVALYYFLVEKNHDKLIDNKSNEPPTKKDEPNVTQDSLISKEDFKRLLAAMPNRRYAFVLEKLILEDMPPEKLAAEMGITVANLYNIKKRAIEQLTQVAIHDIKYYNKQ